MPTETIIKNPPLEFDITLTCRSMMLQLPTGDYLINMTSRNVSQWLVKTRKAYYKRRYGGFEFGVRNPLAGGNATYAREAEPGALGALGNLFLPDLSICFSFFKATLLNRVNREYDPVFLHFISLLKLLCTEVGKIYQLPYMSLLEGVLTGNEGPESGLPFPTEKKTLERRTLTKEPHHACAQKPVPKTF